MDDLPEPTWRLLLGRGLPTLAIEGVLPVLVFYGVWRQTGLGPAVVASTVAAGVVVLVQIRRGMDVALAAVAMLFIAIQALVGVAAHSATVYLAQPVILSAAWGIAYLVSAGIGRPLIAVFAQAWYPFGPEFRATPVFRREFTMQSVVWGVFCLVRASARLAALLGAGVGGFLLVSFATGTPAFAALIAWGLWHARRTFARDDPESLPRADAQAEQAGESAADARSERGRLVAVFGLFAGEDRRANEPAA